MRPYIKAEIDTHSTLPRLYAIVTSRNLLMPEGRQTLEDDEVEYAKNRLLQLDIQYNGKDNVTSYSKRLTDGSKNK